jgi:alpha-L-rhamnosidase
VHQYDKVKERDLVADPGPAIRAAEEVRPARVVAGRSGGWIFDLGRRLVGWPRLKVQAAAGTTVTLRYGPALTPDGALAAAPVSVDRYTTRGKGVEIWEPRFAVHDFRYVEVTGLPGAGRPAPATIVGRVVHSVMPPTAALETSSVSVNRLWSAIDGSQRGAFLSVPSAGPQRVGALLDAGAFAPTACLARYVRGFFRKWIDDLRDAQHLDATFPDTAPAVNHQAGAPGAEAAGVLVPWAQYLCYDDRTALDAHMASMGRWLNHVAAANPDLVWARARGAGAIDPGEQGAPTDPALVATAELAHAAAALAQMARQAGKDLDSYARKYGEMAVAARAAFAKRFIAAGGKLASDTQTAYALALGLDLVPGEARAGAGRALAETVERAGGHATTGLLATAHLLPALSRVGRDDLAYRLLLADARDEATTVEPYARGAVGAWMLDAIGGIALDPEAPAGRHVFVHPRPGAGLTAARARFDSLYGRITTDWRCDARSFRLRVSVPAGATATVSLPPGKITEGGRPLAQAEGVTVLAAGPAETTVRVASGRYDFAVTIAAPAP